MEGLVFRILRYGVFLGVTETIVDLLLCCSVGFVQCLFNLLLRHLVIGPICNTKKLPNYGCLLFLFSISF